MKFFVDNCLPPRIAEALDILDQANEIAHLRKKFKTDVKDLEWIPQLAKEGGGSLITRDDLYRNPQEKEALRKAGFVTFFLSSTWRHLQFWNITYKLFQRWPDITAKARKAGHATWFKVPVRGSKLQEFTR